MRGLFAGIKRYFSGAPDPDSLLKEAMQLCLTEASVHIMKPGDKVEKECVFQEAMLFLRIFEGHPYIVAENSAYDPDQGQEKEVKLPLMEGLTIERYTDEDVQKGWQFKYQETEASWYALEATEYENPPKVKQLDEMLDQLLDMAIKGELTSEIIDKYEGLDGPERPKTPESEGGMVEETKGEFEPDPNSIFEREG